MRHNGLLRLLSLLLLSSDVLPDQPPGWSGLNLGDLAWRPVTNREDLVRSLDEKVGLISVKVDNGTQYLHLGGDLNTFLPIVVNPREVTSSSDLTLQDALNLLTTTGANTGLHISFVSPSVMAGALEVLRSSLRPRTNLTVLLEATVLAADQRSQQHLTNPHTFLNQVKQIPGLIPLLGWATYHGMDKVWKRIEEDNILIEFQLVRLKQILEDLFLRPGQIKDSDVMFVEQLVRRVGGKHESSLTVLALEQLIAAITSNGHPAVQKDPFQPRRPYQPPRSKPIRQILPDYYIGSGAYSRSNVDEMLALTSGLERVGFSVRAGVAANSVEEVARLVEGSGRFLVVSAEPTDKEGKGAVGPLLERVGRNKLILELDSNTKGQTTPGGNPRIPQPKQPRDNSGSNIQTPNLPIIIGLFFLCRVSIAHLIYALNI